MAWKIHKVPRGYAVPLPYQRSISGWGGAHSYLHPLLPAAGALVRVVPFRFGKVYGAQFTNIVGG